ncbi:TPA: PTS transporter subunit EIIB, partial [Listeria monocytogenes]|nr:PTS transporter subunit EIIB [Listeria monocytogenes]
MYAFLGAFHSGFSIIFRRISMDYNQLAKEILQAVGGKNNVNEVYHC